MKPMSFSLWVMALSLLLLAVFAPACAPKDQPLPPVKLKHLVFLTDSTQWEVAALHRLQDSLTTDNYRVIISGYTGETTDDLIARLPWLLQPGVDVLLYDDRLSGAAAFDSLRKQIDMFSPDTEVLLLDREPLRDYGN